MQKPPNLNCDTPNDRKEYVVADAERPVCCPPPNQCLWNSHPRVYLAVADTGQARCPYCSALFVLDKS